jgi:hypothetical protein
MKRGGCALSSSLGRGHVGWLAHFHAFGCVNVFCQRVQCTLNENAGKEKSNIKEKITGNNAQYSSSNKMQQLEGLMYVLPNVKAEENEDLMLTLG